LIVVDASISMAWLIEGEQTPEIMAVLDLCSVEGPVAPSLFHYEIANALMMAQRRRRITRERRLELLAEVRLLDVAADPESANAALDPRNDLADRHGLTVYDSAYLELALRLRLPLATLDARLRRAATEAGATVIP
jgi:predicted nucleic acid-binding protein